jgi:hypothetical protein
LICKFKKFQICTPAKLIARCIFTESFKKSNFFCIYNSLPKNEKSHFGFLGPLRVNIANKLFFLNLYKVFNLFILTGFYLLLSREVCPRSSRPYSRSVKHPLLSPSWISSTLQQVRWGRELNVNYNKNDLHAHYKLAYVSSAELVHNLQPLAFPPPVARSRIYHQSSQQIPVPNNWHSTSASQLNIERVKLSLGLC